jgi:hypothetical protein
MVEAKFAISQTLVGWKLNEFWESTEAIILTSRKGAKIVSIGLLGLWGPSRERDWPPEARATIGERILIKVLWKLESV